MSASLLPSRAAETLGPVINCFLHRLDATLGACGGADTRVLMALRAGLRIEELYRLWLEVRGQPSVANRVLFPASRMMAIKAAYTAQPALALSTLWNESNGGTTESLVRALLNPEIETGRIDQAALGPFPDVPLHEFLSGSTPGGQMTRDHLAEQSEIYARHLARVAGGADRLVIVDSGWKGTSQMLLEAAFPDYSWEGVYFGTIGRSEVLGFKPSSMLGLMFDSTTVDDRRPETSFLVHRHLIESLFEPGITSTEAMTEADLTTDLSVEDLLARETPDPWDAAYEAVKDHLRAHAADSIGRVTAAYETAMARLAEILRHPAPEDVPVYCGKARSFDLGRVGSITSVYPTENRWPWDTPDLRIRQSIWQTGQVALEFTGPETHKRQTGIVNQMKASAPQSYFAGKALNPADVPGTHVAVITRTKNRPLLLRRAAESVAAQTHADYTWVIVNDGGEPEEVDAIVAGCLVDPSRIIVCHNPESLGMEGASNTGIAASRSDFIVIHDDDDSWEPRFLEKTVAFLRANASVYKGVITGTTYVSEEITPTGVVEHDRKPYQGWVRNVQITEMAAGNFLAPIAFLFRRDVCDAIGGFDDALPVLGDWDFNLRYLMQGDIGVLPEPLANYHHRDRGAAGGTYSNSVIGGVDRHAAYSAIVRNKYYRLAARDPAFASLATMIGTGYLHDDLRNRLTNTRDQLLGANSDLRTEREAGAKLRQALSAATSILAHALATEDDAKVAVYAAEHTGALFDLSRAAGPDPDLPTLLAAFRALQEEMGLSPSPVLSLPQDPAGRPAQRPAPVAEPELPSGPSVSWRSGIFKDNWIATEAELSVYDAKTVELTLSIPKADGADAKKLTIFQDDEILQEISLQRGKRNQIRITPKGQARYKHLRLVCDYPEVARGNDIRRLGFICLSAAVKDAAGSKPASGQE